MPSAPNRCTPASNLRISECRRPLFEVRADGLGLIRRPDQSGLDRSFEAQPIVLADATRFIQQAFAGHSDAHPEEPIRVRLGLPTGEALREADKFFGRTVILAARIAAQAAGGEILVSSLVRDLTQSLGEIRFGDVREAELKGIAQTQHLVPVLWN